MANNPVAWFEIYVDDMDRASKFYGEVLAIDFEPLGDPNDSSMVMMAFPSNMEQYVAAGALVKMEGFDAGGNGTLVYFACQDCGIEESRVAAAGGSVVTPKKSIGEYGFMSLVTDTEGNIFGLHSMK